MKITDLLAQSKKPFVSIEIIPPKRGSNVEEIHQAVESVLPHQVKFINVTSHAAEAIWEEMPDGTFKRKVKRKSPGTFGLCAVIKYKYTVNPVPHMLCGGFTREETEDALIELNYLGIDNVMALRGDKHNQRPIPSDRTVNNFAIDLVRQLTAMNTGQYLDEDLIDAAPTNFCIGVAYYPEKHFEAPNLSFELNILKQKAEAGAHFGVSQMFYDTPKYFEFVERARNMGIEIPLLPGVKIMTSKKQLTVLPSIFHINIPEELTDRMLAAKTRAEEIEVGIDWAYKQSLELLEGGAPSLHFYVMQNTKPFLRLMEKLKKHL